MGFITRVYLVYGIPFHYTSKTKDSLQWLIDLVVPGNTDETGWRCDKVPGVNGYFLLDFESDKVMMLCCWWMDQGVDTVRSGPQLVDMPTEHTKEKFVQWCTGVNIESDDVGFYTITNEE
jgi:hypothetical protein